MLKSLHISNYALIDNLDIDFQSGLNIITGETGAGKSIMLGALSLILGERADNKAVRQSGLKSIIEVSFDIDEQLCDTIKTYCQANGIDAEICCNDLMLRREILPSGRSRAFINDTPINIDALKSIALHLVDIHSQNQNQLLADNEYQLQVIDSLADNEQLLQKYRREFTAARKALGKYKTAKREIDNDKANADFIEYKLSQLEAANLIDGEYDDLTNRRDNVANASTIKSSLSELLEILSEGQVNTLSMISRAKDICADLAPTLNDNEALTQRLNSIEIELNDIFETIADADSKISAEPFDIEYIDNRLATLSELMVQNKVDTEAELIDLRDQLRARLERIAESEIILGDLEAEGKKLLRAAKLTATEISSRRKAAAESLGKQLIATASPLGMKNLRCEIRVDSADMNATGIDKVDFLFAFNKNQTLMPVKDTASGGEQSRLMLSLKAIIANYVQLPSIIFDEVDTGVSGEIGLKMAEMMATIADKIQVITITHLPQMAAMGQTHFKVYKEDDEQSTHTRIIPLDENQRIAEIAMMLSGNAENESARITAKEMLTK